MAKKPAFLPRHLRTPAETEELRALLRTPVSKRPTARHRDGEGPPRAWKLYWQKTKLHQAAQIDRLFLLYGVPPEWPELVRWQQLAMSLAAELFVGCRLRSKGGPSEARRERQRALYKEFLAFKPDTRSRAEAAEHFLRDRRKACLKECSEKEKCRRIERQCQDKMLTVESKNFAAAAAKFKQKWPPASTPREKTPKI
jgi:hypothetical protein